MFHTIAFSESQDPGGELVKMAAVPDPSVRVDGDDIVVPQDVNRLFAALGCIGTTGVTARFVSPSLRRLNPYNLFPAERELYPGDLNQMPMHPMNPIQLDYNENLNAEINSDPAAAEQATIVAWLCDGPLQPQTGAIFTARFNTTLALVAGEWVNASISFDDDIPSGVYACGGCQLAVDEAVVGRFYPVGGKYRPGFPVGRSIGTPLPHEFRNFKLGTWFQFDQTQPPTVDILSSAAVASATYNGVMDLIKVG